MLRSVQLLAVTSLIALQLWSCTSSELAGTPLGNQAPQIWLASAPPEGSISRYTIHLYWGGWDPDGEISHYEYIMTNNEGGVFDPCDTTSTKTEHCPTATPTYKWKTVASSDSIFTFTADLIPDSNAVDFEGAHKPEEFRRSHTFFIRAVDREGKRSTTPAYRSFTARTLSPTVFVTLPPPTGI